MRNKEKNYRKGRIENYRLWIEAQLAFGDFESEGKQQSIKLGPDHQLSGKVSLFEASAHLEVENGKLLWLQRRLKITRQIKQLLISL